MCLIFAAPASADAAQRFVTTGGSGTACTSGSPCGIVTGINSAPAGSEVIIAPGTYIIATDLVVPAANITIRGESASAKPVINTSASLTGLDVAAAASNTTISNLRFNMTGSGVGLYIRQAATVNRVEVRSTALEACFISKTTTMRDSICATSAADGTALEVTTASTAATVSLRNVDLIATGTTSGGLEAFASTQNATIDARNVIARGTAIDVYGSSNKVAITFQSSNFANINTNGVAAITAPTANGNQSAAPIFADTDFHPAANSPTVDAGTTDGLTGTEDLEGKLRPQGSGMDIGAYELAVADTTPPDTSITSGPVDGSTVNSSSVSFGFSSTENPSTFQCKYDGEAYSSCTSPSTRSLADGPHTFSVKAKDASNNEDLSPATRNFTISTGPPPDTTPPETTITKAPKDKITIKKGKADVSFSFTSSEPGSTFSCQLDSAAFKPCTSPASYSLAKGAHTFKVRATDSSSNIDASPATGSVTIKIKKKNHR